MHRACWPGKASALAVAARGHRGVKKIMGPTACSCRPSAPSRVLQALMSPIGLTSLCACHKARRDRCCVLAMVRTEEDPAFAPGDPPSEREDVEVNRVDVEVAVDEANRERSNQRSWLDLRRFPKSIVPGVKGRGSLCPRGRCWRRRPKLSPVSWGRDRARSERLSPGCLLACSLARF